MTQYKNNVIQEGNILYYIFQIYLAEFLTYPNELEIYNTNFINKILYFQNNEILNYLSLYSVQYMIH